MLSSLVALAALILSAFATWRTFRFNARQEAFIENQEKLNQRLLERTEGEALAEKKADLGATFVRLGTNSGHRLKIWNKGKAVARNVRIEFPEENEILIESEIQEKFPYEALEPQQGIELLAVVSMGTKRKHAIRLIWDDDSSDNRSKVVYPTL
jgi:hypothetical protein